MLYPDLIPIPLEDFGGYCPALPAANLPPGASPLCQDVSFPMAGLATRGGLKNYFPFGGPVPNNASINGLKSYITPQLIQRLLVWDSLGNFYKESPQGTLNLLASRPQGAGTLYDSRTLFGREYQAFYNNSGGIDIPRQYDDTNWDRVSQVGPGASPTAVNFVPPAATIGTAGGGTTVNIAAAPTGQVAIDFTLNPFPPPKFISQLLKITTTVPHGFSAGQTVDLEGLTGTNPITGVFTIFSIVSPTQFTVAYTIYSNSGASSVLAGGGTASVGPPASITMRRAANTTTANTTAAHNFQIGWNVKITGIPGVATGGAASGSQVGGLVTIQTATPHGLLPGSNVVISGMSDATYDGTFVVDTVPTDTTFTYAQLTTNPGASGGTVTSPFDGIFTITGIPTPTSFSYADPGPDQTTTNTGTATPRGNVSAGNHQISCAFITRQGYITKASIPNLLSAAGGEFLSVSNIPIGPSNIVARLLLFTPFIAPPAMTGSFFSITTGMLINDNSTTGAIINFDDTTLISSFQANYLFSELELGECAFFAGYNARTAWLGERNKVSNFNNLTFDGGFGNIGLAPNNPLGWTLDPAFGPGAQFAAANGFPVDWGDALMIVGDGATAIRGKITQTAYQDYLGVTIIQQNTSYIVRVRLAAANGLNTGTVHINLQSTLAGFTTAGLAVAANQLGANYVEFTANLTDVPLATPPTDLTLQVYADGTPNNGGIFLVDSIEIFPVTVPYNYSTARFSYAFNPEGFDSVTGQVQVRPGDGQQLRAAFPIRSNFYLAKDHYLCYVTDDGVNEPSGWSVNEVSSTIGICGPNAVDWTEEWAVFAERSGLYICFGSDPVKITDEIQFDASRTGKLSWQSVNWQYGFTIWVRIDQVNKKILVGVPVNGATSPNAVFMMDYRWLENAQDIASSPLVTYSAFTGKILAHGRGRRWVPWNITANSMCFAERTDGTVQPFFGNGVGNGKIYEQIEPPTQTDDDGAPINAFWNSYFSPSHEEEMALQLTPLRKLMGYLTWRAVGAGFLLLSIRTAQRATQLRSYILSTNPPADGGIALNIHANRFSVSIGTNAVGHWFSAEKIILYMKKDAAIPVRGTFQ